MAKITFTNEELKQQFIESLTEAEIRTELSRRYPRRDDQRSWTQDDFKNPRNLRRAVFEMRDYGIKPEDERIDILGGVLKYLDERVPSHTNFENVGDFHLKMELPYYRDGRAKNMTNSEFNFRTAAIFEELREFIECHSRGDTVGQADALVDLVYFALGTAHYLRVPFDDCWKAVHEANMLKRRWKPGDAIKPRNNSFPEVVKPEGWKAPDLFDIIYPPSENI